MFEELEGMGRRPRLFEFYTARELWTDEHTLKQMLSDVAGAAYRSEGKEIAVVARER